MYSFSDLVALKVAFELRKSGITTASLKKVVKFLRENENRAEPLSAARLVVTGHDVAIVSEGDLVSVLSKPGQGYLSFVVDLPQMRRTCKYRGRDENLCAWDRVSTGLNRQDQKASLDPPTALISGSALASKSASAAAVPRFRIRSREHF